MIVISCFFGKGYPFRWLCSTPNEKQLAVSNRYKCFALK